MDSQFSATPIPRIARILVLRKNRVTQNSCYWDCTDVSTNAYIGQNPRYVGTRCICFDRLAYEYMFVRKQEVLGFRNNSAVYNFR